jgi:shikimate kinase
MSIIVSKARKMKNSISLIGMAGAGKSSVGKELATALNLDLIDTDDLIENQYKQTLQNILDQQGHIKLRAIEESVLTSINFDQIILSTGGSAVYSSKAMRHLQEHSIVIYLKVPFAQILERVPSFLNRGFAKDPDQTIEEAFLERQVLYKEFAHHTIENTQDLESCILKIISLL